MCPDMSSTRPVRTNPYCSTVTCSIRVPLTSAQILGIESSRTPRRHRPRRLSRPGRLRTELILALGVVLEVVLVLGLGLPEGAGLADLGNYLAVPDA
jgi:hypothetical protein